MDGSDEENCQTTCNKGTHQVNRCLIGVTEFTLILISVILIDSVCNVKSVACMLSVLTF